jgi:hypothetical protein
MLLNFKTFLVLLLKSKKATTKIIKSKLNHFVKVSGLLLTAVGGHNTVSGGQVATSPWSLSLGAKGKPKCFNQGGKGGEQRGSINNSHNKIAQKTVSSERAKITCVIGIYL